MESLEITKSTDIYFSLIIPIFNSEKHISQCLENLINQSIKNIEIVCIDYGSTDESKQLILDYCNIDSRVTLFECDGNINIARNIGISKSKGEFLLFMNPEDLIYVNSCERLYEELIKNPCDVLFFKSSLFDEANKIYNDPINFDLENIYDFVGENIFNYSDINDKIFLLPIVFNNHVFSKKFLLSNNLLFSDSEFCDFSFFFKVILNAKNLKIFNKHIYNKRKVGQKFDDDYFEYILNDFDNLFDFFRNIEDYIFYEKQLLNFIIGKIYHFYLISENKEKIYLLIYKYFNTICDDNGKYVKYISNLNNDNLFFFRDVLKSKTNSEYCLLVKYNKLLSENGKLTSEIFFLKKEVNHLKNQLSYFE